MNKMPINKKEGLIYSILMVTFMAGVMTTYNVLLHRGLSTESIKEAWLVFPISFSLAFLIEWFFIGPLALKTASRCLKETDSEAKKGLITALCFVTGMVIMMSLFGSLMQVGIGSKTLLIWAKNIGFNFIVAFPLQVAIARPLIGTIFRKIFPIGTIIHLAK